MLSRAFLSSAFISKEEFGPLIARAEADNILLIPVIAGDLGTEKVAILNTYQALNALGEPIAKMTDEKLSIVGIRLISRIIDAERLLKKMGVI